MKALQYLIDTAGALIWPTTPQKCEPVGQYNPPLTNCIVLSFYDSIETQTNPLTGQVTNITPTDPVTVGLAGSVTVKAQPTPHSPYLNITNGDLDISMDSVFVLFDGPVAGISTIPSSVTGCNYILCELLRGA